MIDARIRIAIIDEDIKARVRTQYDRNRNKRPEVVALYNAAEVAIGLLRAQYEHLVEAVLKVAHDAKISPEFYELEEFINSVEIDKAEIIAKTLELIPLPEDLHAVLQKDFESHLKEICIFAKLDAGSQWNTGKRWDPLKIHPLEYTDYLNTPIFPDVKPIFYSRETPSVIKQHVDLLNAADEYGGEMLDTSNYGPPEREVDYKEVVGDNP